MNEVGLIKIYAIQHNVHAIGGCILLVVVLTDGLSCSKVPRNVLSYVSQFQYLGLEVSSHCNIKYTDGK